MKIKWSDRYMTEHSCCDCNILCNYWQTTHFITSKNIFFILIYGLSLTCIKNVNLNWSIHFIVLQTTVSPEGVNIRPNDNRGMIDPSWPACQANCPIHLKTKLELNISICYSNENTLSAIKPRYAGDNYFKDTRWPSKVLFMTSVMLEEPP